MKRPATVLLVFLLVVVAACHNSGTSSGSATGATSAEGAVNAFLAAAKARDLQAFSAIWGSARGSVRETMDRTAMERRGVIIMGLLCPDEYHVTGWTAGTGAERNVRAQMKRGTKVIDVEFVAISGPAKRWYVQDFPVSGDLPQRLQAFCR